MLHERKINNQCLSSSLVKLTQTTVNSKEGTSIEESPSSDWPVDIGTLAKPTVGNVSLRHVILGSRKKKVRKTSGIGD